MREPVSFILNALAILLYMCTHERAMWCSIFTFYNNENQAVMEIFLKVHDIWICYIL